MTNAGQHRIHAEAWEWLVQKLRELDHDQHVYITMDHARCLVGAVEREERALKRCEEIREILTRYLGEKNVVIAAAVRPEIRHWLTGSYTEAVPVCVEIDPADLAAVYAHDCANPSECPACRARHAAPPPRVD